MNTINFNTLSDLDIERAILYLLLEEKKTEKLILDLELREYYFISDISKEIYKKISILINDWKKVDYFLVKDLFIQENEVKEFEDFFAWIKFVPEREYINDYLIILKKNYKRSEIKIETKKLEKAIQEKDFSSIKLQQEKIGWFEMDVDEFQNSEIWMSKNEDLATWMESRINWEIEVSNTILKTWYKTIDNSIWWFEKWNYIVFAARPSVWKSVVMINVMESMKEQWYKVAMFSWELYAKVVLRRIISRNLNINSNKLKFPDKMSQKEKQKVKAFVDNLKNDNSRHIYYNIWMTAQMIYEEGLKLKNKYWLDAIFIDYMWKMKANDTKITNWYEKVTAVSNELYELAWKLDVVVVTASQLNRASVNDKEELTAPQMHHFRESWAIEQDIDIWIWIYRNIEEWKMCRKEEDKTDFYMNIMKNRNGALDDFIFDFHPVTWRLNDKFSIDENETKNNITEKDKEKLIKWISSEMNNLEDISWDIFWY